MLGPRPPADGSDPEAIRRLTDRLNSAWWRLYGTIGVFAVVSVGLSYAGYRLPAVAVALAAIPVVTVLLIRYLKILSALRIAGGGPRWRPVGGLTAYPMRVRVVFIAGWVVLLAIGLGYFYLRLRLTVFH
jgi:hypothetical protein